MKYIKHILFLLGMVFVSGQVLGQEIYGPEGVNIPGQWNGWSNSNDPVEMGNFRMNKRTFSGGQYVTTLNISTTGDTTAGTYAWLFTSGADGNEFNNKWANANPINIDGISTVVFQGGTDNSITVENGFYYTIILNDNGYADSEAAVFKTSASPVSITSVTNVPATEVAENQAVNISVELDKPKSPEEKIYVRYSTDNFATSSAIEVIDFGAGTSGTAEIPGQPKNTTVEFYVLSTTIDDANWNGKADLATIHFENNGGENYSYFYEADITPINSASDISRTTQITWYVVDNLAGYDFQLDNDSDFSSPVVDEADIPGTSYTVSNPLDIYTRYYWRFKADTSSNWSSTFNFRTESAVTFANVQFPDSHVMDEGNSLTVYGQLYVPGITPKEDESADISAWIGLNTTEEDPANWDESSWSSATFNTTSTTAGDNDEYNAEVGTNKTPGTYYYAYRYQYSDQEFAYGVIDGFWADTNQTLGELVIKDIPELFAPASNATDVSLTPQLSWLTTDGNINQFNLQVSESAAFETTVIDEQDLPSGTQTYDIGVGVLDYETTYYWRVRSEYDTTASGWSAADSFTTVPAAPAKVTLTTPENKEAGTVLTPEFVWQAEPNANTYDLVVSTDQTFADAGQEVINETTLSTTSFSVDQNNELQKETEYFWRVRGVNETGSGVWSDVNSFTTVGNPPAKVTLTLPQDGASNLSTLPTFEWNAAPKATFYHLQISETETDFSVSESLILSKSDITEAAYTLLQVDKLDEAATYYWRVRASNNAGSSTWSDTLSFTTAAPVPVLHAPQDQLLSTPVNPILSWLEIETAQHYDLQVASDDAFTQIAMDTTAITDTSVVASGLNYGKTYYWRVRSQKNNLNSDWSASFSFTVKANPPAYPQLVSPDSGAVNTGLSLDLVWEAPANAVSYDVQVAQDQEFSGAFTFDTTGFEDTSYLLEGLQNGTTYYWRVRGINNEGSAGQWSETGMFSTSPLSPAVVVLNAPADSVTDVTIPVQFTWEEAARASRYQLQYSEDEAFTFISDTTLIETELSLGNFESGTEYFWRVRSLNGGGSSEWSEVRRIDLGVGGFDGPDLISPENEYSGIADEVFLRWGIIKGADEYQVQLSSSSSFEVLNVDTSGVNAAELSIANLQKATTYYWRVRATDTKASTEWSVVHSFNTLSEAPGKVEIWMPADSANNVRLPVQFSWHEEQEADYYELRLSEQENFSVSIDSSNLRDTTLTLSGLDYDTGYFWQVRAVNEAGTGEWSSLAYFSTTVPLPSAPELVNPEKGEEVIGTVRFGWNEANFAESYHVQVAENDQFESPKIDTSGVSSLILEAGNFKEITTYYWRVRGVNRSGEGAWSAIQTFATAKATSIEDDFVPTEFALHQNYPNPFNPTTNIQYDLKEAGEVRIQVYDISGRLIQTLVNERKSAGRYRVSFEAGNLASGIYLMRMEAGTFLQIKKMMLIK